jgi:hypothetical protein
MLRHLISLVIIAVTIFILAPASTIVGAISTDRRVNATESSPGQSEVPAARLARLRHGINLSHWFAQSHDYSRAHLESHTTAEDIALIKRIGFDHVRLTLEPAPLFNGDDPGRLKVDYLKYLDNALDMIPSNPENVSKVIDTIQNQAARDNLLRYGEDRWNAARIDREISSAAAWAARNHVPLTCNEFGAYRNFAPPADRAAWIRDMRTALERYGIGWTMWDYAGGFDVVNKQNGHAQPDEEVVKALGLVAKKSL